MYYLSATKAEFSGIWRCVRKIGDGDNCCVTGCLGWGFCAAFLRICAPMTKFFTIYTNLPLVNTLVSRLTSRILKFGDSPKVN